METLFVSLVNLLCTWCCRQDTIKPFCGCIGTSQKDGLFALPTIELSDIFSLDNHLCSFHAISGAAIFFGSRLDSFKMFLIAFGMKGHRGMFS